ncbi:transcriptional regulator [Mycobacterium kiyosense]|uniref:Transcriptional regulator n=2 Tax=Mycobacterium kiyosense TaxID=2871094 RepID=A0AA37PXP5_9MYCO|nr:transcriptional regulator [Mycobacterium kiyosense]GLB90572.1 transcriptional regulator [Mycobacterium kiyosense]GLC13869.1 transcriptional regulator [Mycobacterium kiyosense]GLD06236.1 transcriptional regulator [Mycobacterium kiyosense]GLD13159.1 transcriptional regulator [Mycobacterium kiyosense]
MLATMSQHTEIPTLSWSLSELLPTGTVTLLLADVEGSTRLWETQPEQMTAALGLLNRAVDEAVAGHGGVRPVEQGEGDSFVAAFACASDAVACALALQRAPLAPIRIRIGLHAGEIQLRDEGNYAGPTINRAARVRDLAHGGQTVLSGVTAELVADRLPDGVWLTDLGSYPLKGVPRPERVVQLCHPALRNEFPLLRVRSATASHNLPAQLTSFVGRQAQIAELGSIITGNRLVTLTGAGGVGKTRLAVEVSAQLTADFGDGIWYVDLAPLTNPAMAVITVARTFGLPDQPGLSTMDTVKRFIGEKTVLLVLDNCEHLLDVCGSIVVELLGSCPYLAILTTSREPLAVPGEIAWRVPSLALDDEAVELFADRARRARADFVVGENNRALVGEICERLDGMPLAIELAAARIRALSLQQIVDSLHDRFRLLTGGARTAVRRQQTLRASVDWSHALLTEPERVLLRRLAVFAGGFDLDAAQPVGAGSEVEGYQLMDQLGLLVDKSLVVADESDTGMRYRLLETVRQYAQEKLGESGEADQVRTRHRDYYTAAAAEFASRGHSADDELVRWAQTEIDNLRAAFAWSCEKSELETALQLISSLRPLWLHTGRAEEALTGLSYILADDDHSGITPAVWAGAVAYYSILASWVGIPLGWARPQDALATAREIGDPVLITQALIACGMVCVYAPGLSEPYFAEAVELAVATGDRWNLCQIFSYQAVAAAMAGEPFAAIAAAEQGLDLADAIGDRFFSRNCRAWLGISLTLHGNPAAGAKVARSAAEEAGEAGNHILTVFGYVSLSVSLSAQGQSAAARAAAQSALNTANAIGGYLADAVYGVLVYAALAEGDATAAMTAVEMAFRNTNPMRELLTRSITMAPEAALARGDLVAARRWADEAVALVPGWYRAEALLSRAYIALAQGDPGQAERDAHEALAVATSAQAYLRVDDTLECLARLAAGEESTGYAARLLGAADAIRRRMEHPRLPMHQPDYEVTVASVRESLGQDVFDSAWAEGAALSTEEAIAYAQRGRGQRKRPATGWGSLTPMELDVVRLVAEGLGNKEIGARLFVSPRTVQTHLTHVYAKLGLASRVQLVQEAGRH